MREETDMRMRVRFAASAILMSTLCWTAPAAAQTYGTSAGWGGGFMSFAPFAEQGQFSPQEIGLSAPWVVLATAEGWQYGGWVGLRLGGSYSHGTVAFPTADRNISAWGLEAAALLRVLPPQEGRTASAYLIGGGGFMWFNLGEGGAVPIAGTNLIYDDADRRQPMALGGAGLEFMTNMRAFGDQVGVRVEAVDQVTFGSPLRPFDGADSGARHNLRVSIMLFSAVPGIF
jgi:hypothetical protein